MNVHAQATNFQAFEDRLTRALRMVTPHPKKLEEWSNILEDRQKLACSQGGKSVPQFRIFKTTRKATMNNGKIETQTLNTKSSYNEKTFLLHLLCGAENPNIIPSGGTFIPNLMENVKLTYRILLNTHASHVQGLKIIPMVGLSRDAAELFLQEAGTSKTYKQHLKESIGAVLVESTA